MSDDPQRFLEVALEAVKKAEPIFVQHFGHPSGVSLKSDAMRILSLVSDADRTIERVLVEEIQNHFPLHAIVGEEYPPRRGDAYTWYLDPIDGTTNYIRGISPCVISVGLFDSEGPLVGVVSAPQDKVLYHAIRGRGAFKNGKKISVSKLDSFDLLVGSMAGKQVKKKVQLHKKLLGVVRTLRIFASDAAQLAFVAEGKLDCFVTNLTYPWDVAAGLLLVSEAGGKVADWEGSPFTPASSRLVASNGKIHEQLLTALQD